MKKYILRFQISMQNIIVMHVLNCMTDLLNYHPDLLFRKTPLIFQVLIQISFCTKLHQKIQIAFLYKNRVELNDIRMIQKRLNFNLSYYLHNNLRIFDNLILRYLLQSIQKTCFFMTK